MQARNASCPAGRQPETPAAGDAAREALDGSRSPAAGFERRLRSGPVRPDPRGRRPPGGARWPSVPARRAVLPHAPTGAEPMPPVEPSLQMWLTLALTAAAIVAYAAELLPVELIGLSILRRAAAAVPGAAAGRCRRRVAAGPERDPGRLFEPGADRGQRAPGGRRGDRQHRRARGHRAAPGLARARQLPAGADLQPGLRHREQRLPQQHADRRDLHADPALDRRALRQAAERGADAAELRRDPGRHADPDRHLDQPSGLGRARQARRAAVRLLRLHAARAGAGAGGRRLRPAPAAPAAAARRSSRGWSRPTASSSSPSSTSARNRP